MPMPSPASVSRFAGMSSRKRPNAVPATATAALPMTSATARAFRSSRASTSGHGEERDRATLDEVLELARRARCSRRRRCGTRTPGGSVGSSSFSAARTRRCGLDRVGAGKTRDAHRDRGIAVDAEEAAARVFLGTHRRELAEPEDAPARAAHRQVVELLDAPAAGRAARPAAACCRICSSPNACTMRASPSAVAERGGRRRRAGAAARRRTRRRRRDPYRPERSMPATPETELSRGFTVLVRELLQRARRVRARHREREQRLLLEILRHVVRHGRRARHRAETRGAAARGARECRGARAARPPSARARR